MKSGVLLPLACLVHLIFAPSKFFGKSYLQKAVVNCHENLEGFQIISVRTVEEKTVKLRFACKDINCFFMEIR